MTNTSTSPIVWHRGIDDEFPSMLIARNLVCVARIFSSGRWEVTTNLEPRCFEAGSSKNLEVSKTAAETGMVRCAEVTARQLLDWAEKHRRVERRSRRSASRKNKKG